MRAVGHLLQCGNSKLTACLERTPLDYITLNTSESKLSNWQILVAKHMKKTKQMNIAGDFESIARPGIPFRYLHLFNADYLKTIRILGWIDFGTNPKSLRDLYPNVDYLQVLLSAETTPPPQYVDTMKRYLMDLPTHLTQLKLSSEWFNFDITTFPSSITRLILSSLIKDTAEVRPFFESVTGSLKNLQSFKASLLADWPHDITDRSIDLDFSGLTQLSVVIINCSEISYCENTIDLVNWKISAPHIDTFKLSSWYGKFSISLVAPKLLTLKLRDNAVAAPGEHPFINNDDCPSLTQLKLISFELKSQDVLSKMWIQDLPKSIRHLDWMPDSATPQNWMDVFKLPLETLIIQSYNISASQVVTTANEFSSLPSTLTHLQLENGHLPPDTIEFLPTGLKYLKFSPTDPNAADQANRGAPKWTEGHLLQLLQRLPLARFDIEVGDSFGNCSPTAFYWTESPPSEETELSMPQFMASYFSRADCLRIISPLKWVLDESFKFPKALQRADIYGAHEIKDESFYPAFRLHSISFLTRTDALPKDSLRYLNLTEVAHARFYLKGLSYLAGFSQLETLHLSFSASVENYKMPIDIFPATLTELISDEIPFTLSSNFKEWPTKLKRLSCRIREWSDENALHLIRRILENQDSNMDYHTVQKRYLNAIAAQVNDFDQSSFDPSSLPSLPTPDSQGPLIELKGRIWITGATWPSEIHAFRPEIAAFVQSAVMYPARVYGFLIGNMSHWIIPYNAHTIEFTQSAKDDETYNNHSIGEWLTPLLGDTSVGSHGLHHEFLPSVLRANEIGLQLPELSKMKVLTITNIPVAPHLLRYPQNLTSLTLTTRLIVKNDFFQSLPRALQHLTLMNARVVRFPDSDLTYIPASLVTLKAPRSCLMAPEHSKHLPPTLKFLSVCALEWPEADVQVFLSELAPELTDLKIEIHGLYFEGFFYSRYIKRLGLTNVHATVKSIKEGSLDELQVLKAASSLSAGVNISFHSSVLKALDLPQQVVSVDLDADAFMPSHNGLHSWRDNYPSIGDLLNPNQEVPTPLHTIHIKLLNGFRLSEFDFSFPASLTDLKVVCTRHKAMEWDMLPSGIKRVEIICTAGRHTVIDREEWKTLRSLPNLTTLIMPTVVRPPPDLTPPTLTNIECLPAGNDQARRWNQGEEDVDEDDDDWQDDPWEGDSVSHESFHDHDMPDDAYHLGPDAGVESGTDLDYMVDYGDRTESEHPSDESNSENEYRMDYDSDFDEDDEDEDEEEEEDEEDEEDGEADEN